MPSKTLRVLPLGGLGEIGKNMTVVEYDGRIIIVDTGLMFPTAEMHGIDLVLPDFSYLRDRADDIEAIVLTHGHEDHVGALPYVLREIGIPPVIYGGMLTIGMVRSKLDEHKLGDKTPLQELPPGEKVQARAVRARARPPHPLDPRHARRPDHHRGRLDADDRRLQVRPDPGRRPSRRHLAPRRDRPRRAAAALRRLDQRRPPGRRALRVERRPGPAAAVLAGQGADHRHLLRLQHPPRPAGDRRRRGARPQGRSGRSLDAQELQHRLQPGDDAGAAGHLHPAAEIDNFPDEKVVVISTGSQGEPLSALRRMANNDHRDVQLHTGTRSSSRPPRCPATSARSTRRSTASTRSAPPSSPPRRADPRLRPRYREN